jgi:hypothetical protein
MILPAKRTAIKGLKFPLHYEEKDRTAHFVFSPRFLTGVQCSVMFLFSGSGFLSFHVSIPILKVRFLLTPFEVSSHPMLTLTTGEIATPFASASLTDCLSGLLSTPSATFKSGKIFLLNKNIEGSCDGGQRSFFIDLEVNRTLRSGYDRTTYYRGRTWLVMSLSMIKVNNRGFSMGSTYL